uniref:C2H2-type domain-containing protein n=1 Tax=Schistocephalus solidus TaxID=70667 RepID=A0A183TI44_SCHSO
LIFACPVKNCGIFCADEAAFEAHFDAHLDDQPDHLLKGLFRLRNGGQKETRQSQSHAVSVTTSNSQFHDAYFTKTPVPRLSSRKSADTSPQRLLTPRSSLPRDCSLFSDSGAKGDDMLEFMSPDITERPSLPVVSSAATDSADVTPVDSAHTSPTEGTSPMSISDADGRGLLQALDLLPDDLLDELLQEDRAPLFGSSGGAELNLRKLSNSSIELTQRINGEMSTNLSEADIVCFSSPGASVAVQPLSIPPNSSTQSFADCYDLNSLTDPPLNNEEDGEAVWCPCSNSQLPDLASALILPDAERRLRDAFLHTLSSPSGNGIPCRQPSTPDVGRSRPLTPDMQMRTHGGKRQHSCLICPLRKQEGSGQLVAATQPTSNGVGNQFPSAVSCTSAPPSAGPHENHPVVSRPNAPVSASQLLFPKLSSRLSAGVPGRESLNGDIPRSCQIGNTDLFRRPTTEHSRFWLGESGAKNGEDGKEDEGILGERNPGLFNLQHCDCFACPYQRTPTFSASTHLSDTDMPLISSLATAGSTELSASRDALWVPHQPYQRSANRLLKRRRTFLRRPNAGVTPHSGRGGSSINPLSPRPYFRP